MRLAFGISLNSSCCSCPVRTRLGHFKLELLCKFLVDKRSRSTRVKQCLNGDGFWFAMGCIKGNEHHGLEVFGFLTFLRIASGFSLAMDEIRN